MVIMKDGNKKTFICGKKEIAEKDIKIEAKKQPLTKGGGNNV